MKRNKNDVTVAVVRERERESKRVEKTCSACDALNSTKNIYKRMDYGRSLNKNFRAFSKNSLSFLCAIRNETIKNRRYTEKIKRKQKNKLACERGITLFPLIITVVIMIILAAVTINVTLGDGGLIEQAQHVAEATVNSTKAEQEQLDDLVSQLNEILSGSGSTGGGETNTTPGEDTNQIEDANTVDTSSSSGNERFYVMALTDVDGGQTETYYCWYAAAYLNMNDYASTTSTAFGQGEQNTINMIAKWNSSSYGAQNDGMHEDMWGVSAVNNRTWIGSSGWYIPSRDEWAAFADQLNITIDNYSSKGLSIGQWTSSQRKNNHAFGVYFGGGYISSYNVNSGYYVRLGTTF